jgi:hypothetical protein
MMGNRSFWLATLERAGRSGAAALLALLVAERSVWEVEWPAVVGVALMAALVDVLGSLAGGAAKVGGHTGPSLTGAERVERGDP